MAHELAVEAERKATELKAAAERKAAELKEAAKQEMGKLQDTLKEKYEAVKKTVKEGWDTVVTFVDDHKETLKAVATGIIAVGLIVGGIALTTVTLGAATPLIVCIGSGLAMAGVGVGMKQVEDYADDGHFNSSFKEYLSSAASGFVMGFTAPIAGGAATAGMKVLGAGLSMAGGSVVGQSIETGTVSFKQTLTDGLLGAAFGAVGEGLASSGILGKAFNFGKKKILGLVDDFIPKGPAMAEAGTGMKMSVSTAENMGKVELGKIEQTAIQKNYNAVMNPSKAAGSTTDDVAEQVLVKSADDVAVGAGAVAGSRQAEKQLLSGSEWNEYFQQTYGAENVQWATQGQSSITQELSKSTPKLTNGMKMKTNDALDTASEYLGRGYKDMGGGRYVSADGTRQVRFTDSDLAPINNHAGAPHMNFETLVPNPSKPGKMLPDPKRNIHIFLEG